MKKKNKKITLQLIEELYSQGLEDDSDNEHLEDEGFDDAFFNEGFPENDEFSEDALKEEGYS